MKAAAATTQTAAALSFTLRKYVYCRFSQIRVIRGVLVVVVFFKFSIIILNDFLDLFLIFFASSTTCLTLFSYFRFTYATNGNVLRHKILEIVTIPSSAPTTNISNNVNKKSVINGL